MLRRIRQTLLLAVVIIQAVLAAIGGYLLVLTAAAWRAPRRTLFNNRAPGNRFLICIPAHNEAKLLPGLLANIRSLDYPADLFDIHLVADNCTDETAGIARAAGVQVHERFHDSLRGKGYALQWLFQRIWETAVPHDAVLILDADSIVSPNFLRVMDARLAAGERAIQAYYAVRNPQDSESAALRYAALAVLHYLRPQGRMVLGGSAGLKGNGMVFAADLLRRHQWSASLTEDIEYHMGLILAGERVAFAPDALVWAEMPDTLQGSHTQNARWERGRMEMIRHYVPGLLRSGVRSRNFLLVDAAVEQLIPPFSILAGGALITLFGGLLLPVRRLGKVLAGTAGLILLFGQGVYLWAGLHLADAPREVYLALRGVPKFLAWKLWLYARVLLGKDADSWVRTERN